ncbi:MAG: phosphate signaling complex protein PhoU [Pseudomonadales bacterium]|nr:phosphate signaling complex protein PhoU [Pseudomonadales bacterium]
MNKHISEQYDSELDSARSLFMEIGGLVEQQVHKACQSLFTHDAELADAVKKGDRRINKLEINVDELCVHIIARRQPAATDLRTLISIMKASTDLERIGDEAKRISKMAKAISHLEFPKDQYSDVRAMSEQVHEMLAKVLDAFARLSPDKALEVIDADEAVDEAYDAIVRERGLDMMKEPTEIQRSLNVIWIARALERIGDHCKNISEYIVYLIKGLDVRHTDDVAAAVSNR